MACTCTPWSWRVVVGKAVKVSLIIARLHTLCRPGVLIKDDIDLSHVSVVATETAMPPPLPHWRFLNRLEV